MRRSEPVPVTSALAHSSISASEIFLPPTLSLLRKERVWCRMSCQTTPRMSFWLPSEMSLPPMFVMWKPIFLAMSTIMLQFSTFLKTILDSLFTFFQSTQPGSTLSSVSRSTTPSCASEKRFWTMCSLPSEFIQFRKARSSRESPSSPSSVAMSNSTLASSMCKAGCSLNRVATKARLSFWFPPTTSEGFTNLRQPILSAS
mmetsp:Transcript_44896/g.68654  ORF Transcript_44896/g.68654 Transcript_44896/m.68654 type:complete len:201 (+) Transcript_44896:299-901(+)